jgi:hypothetical protein
VTEQLPHTLTVDDPAIDFGTWSLYGVIRGVPTRENSGWGDGTAYAADPGSPPAGATCNWAGFVPAFRITRDDALVLERFEYWSPDWPDKQVNETLDGDFYLVLLARFFGPRLYVPFRGGRIVLDRAAWLHETDEGAKSEYRAGCHPDFPAMPRWAHTRTHAPARAGPWFIVALLLALATLLLVFAR